MTSTQKTRTLRQKFLSLLPYLLLPLAIYFGNVELQSYLGRQALEKVSLEKHSLEEALRIAKRENKRVLADMSAIWCQTCRKLDKEVLAQDAVQARINEAYVFTRLEYESDEGKAFMARYGVTGFPTLLVLNADGDMLRKLPLTFSPEKFILSL